MPATKKTRKKSAKKRQRAQASDNGQPAIVSARQLPVFVREPRKKGKWDFLDRLRVGDGVCVSDVATENQARNAASRLGTKWGKTFACRLAEDGTHWITRVE